MKVHELLILLENQNPEDTVMVQTCQEDYTSVFYVEHQGEGATVIGARNRRTGTRERRRRDFSNLHQL